MRVPELLSPAGDMERLKAAVQYGADAVYLGSEEFGMRASARNFNDHELREALDYCHKRGVKVYLTVNVLLRNEEIAALEYSLHKWQDMGVDALIISDMGIFLLARRVIPEIELHISTQAGVTNFLTARELYHQGAKRVVLARELSLEDIRTIRENVPEDLGLEVFAHGAMCVSFSGRCLISQYMTGRDGNHGECAQSCRWKYHLVEEKRPGEYYPVVEEESGTYFFNAKDLCMLPYIDKLAEAGVDSIKIEGRAKSVFYAIATTNMYRQGIDLYAKDPENFQLPPWLAEEPYKISHREYSTGFYFPEQPADQVYENAGYIREWEVVGMVEGWQDGVIHITQRNKFAVGDELELVQPGKPPILFTVERLTNEHGEEVADAPHPMEPLNLPFPEEVPLGAYLRGKTI